MAKQNLEEMNKFKEGVEATPELLKLYGFTERCGPIVTNYSMNIGRNKLEYKEVSITLSPGNQYIMARQGDLHKERHKDDVIVLYNGDYDGKLMMHRINHLMYGLTGKWLEVVDSVKKC
jgi:hypothetical protein